MTVMDQAVIIRWIVGIVLQILFEDLLEAQPSYQERGASACLLPTHQGDPALVVSPASEYV